MTAGSTTTQLGSSHETRTAVGVSLAALAIVLGLLLAGQAGLLPRSPTFTGDPADQYLSQQTLGERLAAA
jgi:hypothetical protein